MCGVERNSNSRNSHSILPRHRRGDPNGDAPHQNYSDHCGARGGGHASPPREVQELSSSSSPEQPPRKEPVEEPPQQAEGRQEDIAIPGFEPSDD
ncbi:hypothetical protein R1flu_021070 [Riccia fluitans]|uniref:Uncharacterized protein n=1 Tax=Riccia fluitans TaxID=41844 RepID=A0ABD1ZPH5_9MARC